MHRIGVLKECPLTELAYCIIAFRYGERFVMFLSEVLAEERIFFLPDMAWYNVL